jgi:hypothetical protein
LVDSGCCFSSLENSAKSTPTSLIDHIYALSNL